PGATTSSQVTVLGTTSAVAGGTANGYGLPLTFQVEYGPTTAYGSRSLSASLPAGSYDQPVTFTLSNLTPAAAHPFPPVATSSAGTTYGVDRTFTTATPPAPFASAGAASQVATTSAVLNGTVNPNGGSTTYRFEWGTTAAYGNQTTSTGIGAGLGDAAVS